MEFFGSAFTLVTGYIVPFLFVLTIVVFFHELGHFLVARWCGVGVETFSIGFGREIVGWNDKHGTRWRLSLIPLGGYVKFVDDSGEASTPDLEALEAMTEEQKARSFHLKPLWAKSAIVSAGPIANFLLAIVIFSFVFSLNGKQLTLPIVDSVQSDSAAAVAGLKPGDRILSIDGNSIESFLDLQRVVSTSAGLELTFEVDRAGEILTLRATPRRKMNVDQFGNEQNIGLLGVGRSISAEDIIYQKYTIPEAIGAGVWETWFIAERTVTFIGGMITGRESTENLGGPIRIAKVSGQIATLGIGALINWAGLLSVSIGLLNLFPIPMLDGGHLMFYAIEAVRGRPLSDRMKDIGFRVGLALVVMLMAFATWNDILSLATS